MKKGLGDIISICLLFFINVNCKQRLRVHDVKDLDEHMMDLRVYQENLGDQIKAGHLQDAQWLLTGMDSILQIVSIKFDEHRKLSGPFSYFYKRRLRTPIRKIQEAIHKNDTALARKNYGILVKKCNGCHIDNDIDKEVKY